MTHRHSALTRKWLLSVPLLFLAFFMLAAMLPALLLATAVLSLLPRYAGALRAVLFLGCYLLCEIAGVVVSLWIWLRYRHNEERFMQANFKLQCWWAARLMAAAKLLFSLNFHEHNSEALEGPAALLMPRHASIADTVLPMTYYAIPRQQRLRYVLKTELQWDPCLDIVGNRLPNYFTDRASHNTEEEVAGVVKLLTDAPANESLLIYPEGTRFSVAKHQQLRAKSTPGSELAEQLDRWNDLLPPRLGGCLGLLQANTRHDLLFLAHSGFEGSASFVELVNGSWCNSDVHLEFWRIPFANIPQEPGAQREFLFTQWDRMQQTVVRLKALRDDS